MDANRSLELLTNVRFAQALLMQGAQFKGFSQRAQVHAALLEVKSALELAFDELVSGLNLSLEGQVLKFNLGSLCHKFINIDERAFTLGDIRGSFADLLPSKHLWLQQLLIALESLRFSKGDWPQVYQKNIQSLFLAKEHTQKALLIASTDRKPVGVRPKLFSGVECAHWSVLSLGDLICALDEALEYFKGALQVQAEY